MSSSVALLQEDRPDSMREGRDKPKPCRRLTKMAAQASTGMLVLPFASRSDGERESLCRNAVAGNPEKHL